MCLNFLSLPNHVLIAVSILQLCVAVGGARTCFQQWSLHGVNVTKDTWQMTVNDLTNKLTTSGLTNDRTDATHGFTIIALPSYVIWPAIEPTGTIWRPSQTLGGLSTASLGFYQLGAISFGFVPWLHGYCFRIFLCKGCLVFSNFNCSTVKQNFSLLDFQVADSSWCLCGPCDLPRACGEQVLGHGRASQWWPCSQNVAMCAEPMLSFSGGQEPLWMFGDLGVTCCDKSVQARHQWLYGGVCRVSKPIPGDAEGDLLRKCIWHLVPQWAWCFDFEGTTSPFGCHELLEASWTFLACH